MRNWFETLLSKLSSHENSFASNFEEGDLNSHDQKLLAIIKANPHLIKMLLADEEVKKSIEKQESSIETPEKRVKRNHVPTSQKKTLGDSAQIMSPESLQKWSK